MNLAFSNQSHQEVLPTTNTVSVIKYRHPAYSLCWMIAVFVIIIMFIGIAILIFKPGCCNNEVMIPLLVIFIIVYLFSWEYLSSFKDPLTKRICSIWVALLFVLGFIALVLYA
jgi:hypothetical protein